MKVLVLGATGETGRRIVRVLVDQGWTTRAMVRDRAKAATVLPAAAEVVVGDLLDRSSLAAAIDGCNILVCASGARPNLNPLGPLNVDYVGFKQAIDLAKAAQVQHVVLVSSLCVSRFFHPLNLFWLVLFWKLQAEAYLRQSGLTYTIVRPGGLKNDDLDTPVIMAGADRLFQGSIPRLQVARVAVAALTEPSAQNKIVEIVAEPGAPIVPWSEAFARV